VTWVLSGDEHVAEYQPPPNVVSIEPGRTLEELVGTGEVAAAIGVTVDHPDVAPLIPDAADAGFGAFQSRGLYPINHLVVVKDEVLAARPEVATAVFDAFTRAKDLYVERLRAGAIDAPTSTDLMYGRVLELTGDDPLPYGIEPNRATIEKLIGHAVTQQILDRPMPVETLFADCLS